MFRRSLLFSPSFRVQDVKMALNPMQTFSEILAQYPFSVGTNLEGLLGKMVTDQDLIDFDGIGKKTCADH